MSFLRSDEMVALNELIIACRAAADFHAEAAAQAPEPALGRALHELGRDRAQTADRLAEFVLAREDIPEAPSAEMSLLETAVTRVKIAVGDDAARVLLEDCGDKERQLTEAAAVLLGLETDDEVRRIVSELKADAESRIGRIRRAQPEAPPGS